MTEQNPKPWRAYEELSRVLLEEWSDTFGLGLESVEGTQKLVGKSGATWAVDAKGVRAGDSAIVLVECKRWNSRVDQATVGALAHSIRDVGAAGGILVTPIGVQRGGQLVAEAEEIEIVHLEADDDATSYVMKFLGNIVIGPTPATARTWCPAPTVTVTPAEPESSR